MTARILAVAALAAAVSACSLIVDVDEVRRTRDAGGTAQVVADRTALDFGSSPTGKASAPAVIVLSNAGTAPAGAFTVELTGAGAAAFGSPDVSACDGLAPGATCEVSLAFTPTAAQSYSATLNVTATPGGTVTLLLSGTGVVPGALTISPDAVDFGSVVQAGRGASVTFTVTNTSTVASGQLTALLTGVDALQFEVSADGCTDQVLAPDADCTVVASFAPGTPGPRRATLTVSGAPGGTAVAALSGLGLLPGTLGISPSSRQLASVPVGSQGMPVTFQVTNSGAAPTGALTLALTGSGEQDFEVVTTDCRGAVLQPTTSCTAQVRFAPRNQGIRVATFTVSGEPGGNASAALSATAQAPAALSATPTSYDFGTTVVGSPAQAVIHVENGGAIASGVPTAVISGADATQFSITADGCTAALTAGSGCDIELQYAPSDAGVAAAELVVSATPGGAATVPLTGTSVTPGALEINPQMFAFGQVTEGMSSAPRIFTVTNKGGSATSAITIGVSGTNASQFQTSNDGCTGMTLASMASCDVTVTFMPTGGGSKSASLAASATTGGTATSALNGAGKLQAALTINDNAFTFLDTVNGELGSAHTFTITNVGDVPTDSALAATLTGAGAASFSFTSNSCSTSTLGAGADCAVTVQFTPPGATLGPQTATLEVAPMSGPGGTVMASLQGTSVTASALGFDVQSFGSALIGTTVDKTFTLTNGGGAPSGNITFSIGGTDATEFQILPATGTDCISGDPLPGGASCTVRVRWTVGGRYSRTAQLTATATPGGPANRSLNGTGQQQATLSSADTIGSLGSSENGVQSATTFGWQVSNTGDLPTGVPTVTKSGSNPGDFSVSGCTSAIPPGNTCTVTITFTPTTAGPRAATVRVAANPGGSVQLAASGTGLARITVTMSGGASGTVTSSPAGITCPGTCSALFSLGAVTLTATTTNGTSTVFRRFTGDCTGTSRSCVMPADNSKAVTATFAPVQANVVFVSSLTWPNDRGSAAGYDADCNAAATAAGINNAAGDAYVAWVSDASSLAKDRIGPSARGFERVDGLGLVDQLSDLLGGVNSSRILNAISLDERGNWRNVPVRTGTDSDGQVTLPGLTCNGWTVGQATAGVFFKFGVSSFGPANWTELNVLGCETSASVYCFMKTQTAAYAPPVGSGKRIWLSETPYIPSTTQTPNQKCTLERPPGVVAGVALLGTSTVAAAAALVPSATYVRPDLQVVGTGAELAADTVRSGVWQTASGLYRLVGTWTGYGDVQRLTNPPPNASVTCNDWTSTATTGIMGRGGLSVATDTRWFAFIDNASCGEAARHLICVEP